MKDFSSALERFNAQAAPPPSPTKLVEIKPVITQPRSVAVNKIREHYTERVLSTVDAMSTGELMQMIDLLNAVLDARKETV